MGMAVDDGKEACFWLLSKLSNVDYEAMEGVKLPSASADLASPNDATGNGG